MSFFPRGFLRVPPKPAGPVGARLLSRLTPLPNELALVGNPALDLVGVEPDELPDLQKWYAALLDEAAHEASGYSKTRRELLAVHQGDVRDWNGQGTSTECDRREYSAWILA